MGSAPLLEMVKGWTRRGKDGQMRKRVMRARIDFGDALEQAFALAKSRHHTRIPSGFH